MAMNECPKCGGSQVVPGKMWSAGSCSYKSDAHSIFRPFSCKTYVCKACGYMETYMQPESLRKLTE